MKDYFLLTTEHLEDCLWFREDSDFKVAMNYVAIQAACCPDVDVLAFILMSNHVHFVLNGSNNDIMEFITQFKHRYAIYYWNKYGVKEFLRRNDVDVRLIPCEEESLERAIAYVQMNCVAANICLHPSQYQWGTGDVFFSKHDYKGSRLGDMTARARIRMLHSECDILPLNWTVSESGFIKPKSFVAFQTVEALFRNPRRMNYFLNSSSKAKKRIETVDDNHPAFKDQTILKVLPDLCWSLFHKSSFKELQTDEQIEFARQIRFRFCSDANQIARVCEITYAEAAGLLDNA
jgi:REP element-mobilizing transposase RayT